VSVYVRVTKEADVDDDIAETLLSDFADWLDEHGLLREGKDDFQYAYNLDLVKKFMDEIKKRALAGL
jgi:hypothetical protein